MWESTSKSTFLHPTRWRTTWPFGSLVSFEQLDFPLLFAVYTCVIFLINFCFSSYAGPFLKPKPTKGMVERAALLASMTPSEKSVKNFVVKAHLQLATLLDPHQNVRDTTKSTTKDYYPDPLVKVFQQPLRQP